METLQDLFDLELLDAATSKHLATVDPSGSLTYGEVADQVARLAALLQTLDVAPGDRVGISLETSTRSIVASHAVLRAGGVVVPIDPRAPVVLANQIVEDTEIDVVITDAPAKTLDRRLEAMRVAHVVSVAPIAQDGVVAWDTLVDHDPAPMQRVGPDDLAYIIFTSGSTGRPKGIAHTHASGLAYAGLATSTYDLSPSDRIAQPAAMHFDQSTLGLYAAPYAGASSVMIPESLLVFPASVAKFAAEQRTTIWYSVPTLIMRLVQSGGLSEHDLSAMRWVKFGGEVFPPGQLQAAMQAIPARFSNVYGPAEVNQCTFFHLDQSPLDDEVVPIGRAWDQTEVAIVGPGGQTRQPLAVGEQGELVVRSSTAMQGYWRQPDLSDAAWCQVPELEGQDTRPWYATGDLCVQRNDAEIVFLGRIDNQVKVRGHRVEIEAIESALIEFAAVAGAAVVVDHTEDGTTRLVAMLEGDHSDPLELKRSLKTTLPSYAVPDEIVWVDSLPRTGTGKVDRLAAAAQRRS